jgi:aldehyde dehydrogenase (NAD+)
MRETWPMNILEKTFASILANPQEEALSLLEGLGVPRSTLSGGSRIVRSPVNGEEIAAIRDTTPEEAEAAIARSQAAFRQWRGMPAPKRGEFVRLLGLELRQAKAELGRLVTLEAGKITSEGLGEVQEMIDICDFAVGLSRQLHGLTIATERPNHRMMETWHPLGPVGVISAFNFPVAVWSWCGSPRKKRRSPHLRCRRSSCAQRPLSRRRDLAKSRMACPKC